MRIPYIIRDPSPDADGTRGQVFDHFVEAVDSAPTLMQALGEDLPDRFQGRSLLPLLRGQGSYEPKKEIHYEFDYRGAGMAAQETEGKDPDVHLLWVVRDREFKYVHFANGEIPPILFDLRTDPDELNNVAGLAEYASIELECCQRLLRWRMYCEDQRGEHWAQPYR